MSMTIANEEYSESFKDLKSEKSLSLLIERINNAYVPHLHDHAVRGGVNDFKYIVKAMQTGYDTVVTKSQKKRHLY